ncbi:hypothetical protein ACOSQ3_006749 [Xanthoceras sorbifolium]
MGEELKLHGTSESPFSLRVVWALKLKGIPYDFVEEDLFNKSALLLQYNPVHKKIPVLVHAGKPICESMIIIEYIEEMWPHTPLLPTHVYDRNIARFWVKFAEDKVLEMLEIVEEHSLGDKKYFNGEKIGMVDIAFGSILYWLCVNEEVLGVKLFEPHKFPRLHKWFQNFQEVPVIKHNLPNRDNLIVFFKRRRESLEASVA